MVGRLRGWGGRRFELPLVAPVELVERDLPMDPYALGRLLGDGSEAGPGHEAVDAVGGGDGAVRREGGGAAVLTVDPVTQVLRELGLAGRGPGATFVPEDYKLNASRVRSAVLQGLLDTTGGQVTRRGRRGPARFSTSSRQLRDDVVYLVRSLGGVAYARTNVRCDTYVVDIHLPEGSEPFGPGGKRAAYGIAGGGQPRRFVDSIEPAGEAETLCIRVAAADSLYVTEDLLLTHNTLNDAFIILDEAQNTSPEQMKMFLTRLGFGSKMVVTGDVTQVDLPEGTRSGLRVVREILADVEDIHFSILTPQDVVRHRLVGAIVDAYGRWDTLQVKHQGQPGTQQGGRGPRERRRPQ
jgi:phosphate starvation-inducible PhoH-like protein